MVLLLSIRDVKGDGSCFYRALYNASLHTGNLRKVLRAFGIKTNDHIWNEELFVAHVRKALATCIMESSILPQSQLKGRVKTTYNLLHNIYTNIYEIRKASKETYYAMLEAYPTWFSTSFKKLPHSFQEFCTKLSHCITKKSNWVSEIEVRLVEILSSRYSVSIQIFNSFPQNTIRLNCTTIYLLNRSETHYNYILCRDCDPQIINPPTTRCVKKNGNIGKRLRGMVNDDDKRH